MNRGNPFFWALIGFGVGAVIAAAGSIATPVDSILGGLIQALIWFGVASFIIKRKSKKVGLPYSAFTESSLSSNLAVEDFVQAKICDFCQERVPMDFAKSYAFGQTGLMVRKDSKLDLHTGS